MDETSEIPIPSTDMSFGDENGQLRVSKQLDGTWFLDFTFGGVRNTKRVPTYNPGGILSSLTSLQVGVDGLKDAIADGNIEIPTRIEGHTKTPFLINLFEGIEGVVIDNERDIMGKRVMVIDLAEMDETGRKERILSILNTTNEKLKDTQTMAAQKISSRNK